MIYLLDADLPPQAQPIPVGEDGMLQAVDFLDRNRGLAVGVTAGARQSPFTIATDDGGRSWRRSEIDVEPILSITDLGRLEPGLSTMTAPASRVTPWLLISVLAVSVASAGCGGGGNPPVVPTPTVPSPAPPSTVLPPAPPAPSPAPSAAPAPSPSEEPGGPVAWATGIRRRSETDDGGERWRRAEILSESSAVRRAALSSICLTPEGLGLAAGEGVSGAAVLRSIDGGESWEEITENLLVLGSQLACLGDRLLWVTGSVDREARPVILHSSNAGLDWERQAVRDVEGSVNALVFLDAERGWAVGYDSRSLGPLILRTRDGGRLWEPDDVPDVGPGSSSLTAISVLPSGAAIAAGRTSEGAEERALALLRLGEDAEWQLSMLPQDLRFVLDVVLLP